LVGRELAGGALVVVFALITRMLLAFRAILTASLTLIEQEEGRRRAYRKAMGGILGAFGYRSLPSWSKKRVLRIEPFLVLGLGHAPVP
jgi:hypothetical protein